MNRKISLFVPSLLLFAIEAGVAIGRTPPLPEDVLNKRGGIVIAQVAEVHIQKNTDISEEGQLVLKVEERIAGADLGDFLTLPYRRRIARKEIYYNDPQPWETVNLNQGSKLVLFWYPDPEKKRIEAYPRSYLSGLCFPVSVEELEALPRIAQFEEMQDPENKFHDLKFIALKDSNPYVQMYALRRLSTYSPSVVRTFFVDILRSHEGPLQVRQSAIYYLQVMRFGYPDRKWVDQAFIDALSDPLPEIRLAILVALLNRAAVVSGDEVTMNLAIPPAIEALLKKEKDPTVLKAALDLKARILKGFSLIQKAVGASR